MKRTAEERERLIEQYRICIETANRGFLMGWEASTFYHNGEDDRLMVFDERFAVAVDKLLDKLGVCS